MAQQWQTALLNAIFATDSDDEDDNDDDNDSVPELVSGSESDDDDNDPNDLPFTEARTAEEEERRFGHILYCNETVFIYLRKTGQI